MIGSSSVAQSLGRVLERELEQRGYEVSRKGFSSAGLSRPDFRDMQKLFDDLPITRETAAVFVYLGVNDAQALWLAPRERGASGRAFLPWSDDRWSELYAERARRLVERVCQRGAKRAFVMLPVDVRRTRLQRRLNRIRELQARAVARTSCGVVLVTSGDESRFGDTENPLRRRDGFHLTQRGAEVVWQRIRPKTVAALRRHDRPAARPEARKAAARQAHAAASERRAELDALVARIFGEASDERANNASAGTASR